VAPGTGFPAAQQHDTLSKTGRLRFEWNGATYRVRAPVQATDVINRRQHAQSLAPNVIHSLDAAHLMLIVAEFRRRCAAPVGTIHDSFATWATTAAMLAETFKSNLAQLYGVQNPLVDLA